MGVIEDFQNKYQNKLLDLWKAILGREKVDKQNLIYLINHLKYQQHLIIV